MLIMGAIASLIHYAFSQEKHPPHPSELDFYRELRIMPIEVTYYEPVSSLVYWKYESKDVVETGAFQVTTTTQYKAGTKLKGKIVVIYCSAEHGTGPNNRHKYLVYAEKAK